MASIDVRIPRAADSSLWKVNTESMFKIPYIDFGSAEEPVIFLHANGYPPGCYDAMLTPMSRRFPLRAMLQRPLWPDSRPQSVQSWHPFSTDLLAFLQQQRAREHVVIGHSMGAIAALRAALAAPDQFAGLVLLDPVLVSKGAMLALGLLRRVGLNDPLRTRARRTMQRKRHFGDLSEVFHSYRGREVFRRLSDQDLRVMIKGLFQPDPAGGFDLVYSPHWEAHIYRTAIWNDRDLWAGIPQLQIPTLIVRGAHSTTFTGAVLRDLGRLNPRLELRTVPAASHLLPFEQPVEVMRLIGEFLTATRSADFMAA